MTTTSTQADLHKAFIAMIFAFAVSFVAQQVAEYLIVITNNWQFTSTHFTSGIEEQDRVGKIIAVGTHLFLSMLMLSVSWVMWSRSQAAGHLEDVKGIFTIKFATFILEVLLVTIYYSLAKTAEADFSAYGKTKSVSDYITEVSARPEAAQMAAVFIIFAIWDLIVDVIRSPRTPRPNRNPEILLSYLTGTVVYCFVSIVCAVAAIMVFNCTPQSGPAVYAYIGDFALVMTLLFFHQAKTLEFYLVKIFPGESTRNNTKRTPSLGSNIGLGALILAYISSMLIINLPCLQKSLGL